MTDDPDFDLGPMPTSYLLDEITDPEVEEGDGEEEGPPVAPVIADEAGEPVADDATGARSLSTVEPTTILRNLGWRIRTTAEYAQAVGHFQQAYLIGAALSVDKVVGPKTLAAMRQSIARKKAGLPTASAHFSFTEYRCRCSNISATNSGGFNNCARIWVTRANLVEAEQYRSALGGGVSVVSGCRCVGHNKAVGGASQSQHLVGKATDFPALRSVTWFTDHKIYKPGGLGANPSKLVRHGDVGPDRGWNYQS
jgi:hypothetical protein